MTLRQAYIDYFRIEDSLIYALLHGDRRREQLKRYIALFSRIKGVAVSYSAMGRQLGISGDAAKNNYNAYLEVLDELELTEEDTRVNP